MKLKINQRNDSPLVFVSYTSGDSELDFNSHLIPIEVDNWINRFEWSLISLDKYTERFYGLVLKDESIAVMTQEQIIETLISEELLDASKIKKQIRL